MSYKVQNKAKQPIICSLADDSTLRLPIGGETTIAENQVNEHIEHLIEIGDLKVKKDAPKDKVIVANEQQIKKKEEKENAKS